MKTRSKTAQLKMEEAARILVELSQSNGRTSLDKPKLQNSLANQEKPHIDSTSSKKCNITI